MTRKYFYVGPDHILDQAVSSPGGKSVTSPEDLFKVIECFEKEFNEERGWMTYIIDMDGRLTLAPRRTEHINCAGGNTVLGAGEIRFDREGKVLEITNNSTGFCPDIGCWKAVSGALENTCLSHPDFFTSKAVFRLCNACGERNIVKDDWFYCEICGAELSGEWNFR